MIPAKRIGDCIRNLLSLWHFSRIEERPVVSCECQLSPPYASSACTRIAGLKSQRSGVSELAQNKRFPDRGTTSQQHAAPSRFAAGEGEREGIRSTGGVLAGSA